MVHQTRAMLVSVAQLATKNISTLPSLDGIVIQCRAIPRIKFIFIQPGTIGVLTPCCEDDDDDDDDDSLYTWVKKGTMKVIPNFNILKFSLKQ